MAASGAHSNQLAEILQQTVEDSSIVGKARTLMEKSLLQEQVEHIL